MVPKALKIVPRTCKMVSKMHKMVAQYRSIIRILMMESSRSFKMNPLNTKIVPTVAHMVPKWVSLAAAMLSGGMALVLSGFCLEI